MTDEWYRRLELAKAGRDDAQRRVVELEDEVGRLRDIVVALEAENYDLEADKRGLADQLAECRRRHPSTRRRTC